MAGRVDQNHKEKTMKVIPRQPVFEAFHFAGLDDLRALFHFVLQDDSKKRTANVDFRGAGILVRIYRDGDAGAVEVRDGQWVVRSEHGLTVMDEDKFSAEYQHISTY
jgi:hypothetical protein